MNALETETVHPSRRWSGMARLMAVVAVAAVISSVIRGEGSQSAGALLVGASVVILARKLATDALARERRSDTAVRTWRKQFVFANAFFLAVTIIELADLGFLWTYSWLKYSGVISGIHSHYDEISIGNVLAATCAVVFATRQLRRVVVRYRASRSSSKSREVLPEEDCVEE